MLHTLRPDLGFVVGDSAGRRAGAARRRRPPRARWSCRPTPRRTPTRPPGSTRRCRSSWPTIREQAPASIPRRTPASRRSASSRTVRTAGRIRSITLKCRSPRSAPRAAKIVGGQRLDDALGERLAARRRVPLDGKVCLLGVGHDSDASLHLAGVPAGRAPRPPHRLVGAPAVRLQRSRPPGGRGRGREADFERLGADSTIPGTVADRRQRPPPGYPRPADWSTSPPSRHSPSAPSDKLERLNAANTSRPHRHSRRARTAGSAPI